MDENTVVSSPSNNSTDSADRLPTNSTQSCQFFFIITLLTVGKNVFEET